MGKRVLPYRRKMEGRTDYRKRLTLLKSGLPRLVVRRSNKSVQAQLVIYDADGDNVVATARATDLKKLGWSHATGNLPAAYLTGALLASKAKQHKIKEAIVDIGLQAHHRGGRLYAVVKGAIDAGLTIRCSEDALPAAERANGSHISEQLAASVASVQKKIMSENNA